MKRVLPLLLLAFVMCQCNFGPSQDQPAKKSLRDKVPEKFTEEYIGDRALTLGDKLCNCDPYNVYAFNNVFTSQYGDLLKEALALPADYNEDYNLVWISFSEEMCSLVAVTDIKVNDNKAKITMDSEYLGKDELSMVFVDDEWLIDDLGNCSRSFLKEVLQNQRKFYKSIDWLEYIEDLEYRGYSKEEAVEMSNQFKEEIETYFENYPK